MNPRTNITERQCVETPARERPRSLAGTRLLRGLMGLLVLFAAVSVAAVSVAQQVVAPQGEVIVQEIINPDREASVKAVFLYSYGRYVTWPDTLPEGGPGKTEDDFVIGVLGHSAVTAKLERIAKKRKIAGRSIQLIQVESLEKIPHCHILYAAGHTDELRQKAIVQATAGQPLLLVGESHGFAERGAAINFYVSGNSVRFQINAETVRQRGLQLNAKLLNLGDRVGGPPEN